MVTNSKRPREQEDLFRADCEILPMKAKTCRVRLLPQEQGNRLQARGYWLFLRNPGVAAAQMETF